MTTTTTVSLRSAAETEAARLAGARMLANAGDEEQLARLDADGPWILVARRSALRRRLGGRALFLWEIACEDGDGLTVESRLMAIAVRLASRAAPRTRAWRRRYLPAIEAELSARINSEAPTATAEAADAARSFLAARLRREEAMAAQTRNVHPALAAFQPGLFDVRAVRRHRDAVDADADARLDAANRIAALERSAMVRVRPARLLLVVVP